MKAFDIRKPEEKLRASIREKIDNLNKPKGSLGRLESLAEQICMIQQTLPHAVTSLPPAVRRRPRHRARGCQRQSARSDLAADD